MEDSILGENSVRPDSKQKILKRRNTREVVLTHTHTHTHTHTRTTVRVQNRAHCTRISRMFIKKRNGHTQLHVHVRQTPAHPPTHTHTHLEPDPSALDEVRIEAVGREFLPAVRDALLRERRHHHCRVRHLQGHGRDMTSLAQDFHSSCESVRRRPQRLSHVTSRVGCNTCKGH